MKVTLTDKFEVGDAILVAINDNLVKCLVLSVDFNEADHTFNYEVLSFDSEYSLKFELTT